MQHFRHIHVPTQLGEIVFAKAAAEKFQENPELVTFTDGAIKEGELFAVRWGLDRDCILVFEIGDEPRVYDQIIKKV